ncbi:polysaccharide deacetylase family protein [Undibacterium sp. RuTC16W]|uniref:polysaccharide deacetylase family protein n=1 Tax=Undibacterium sp. RuTC16W TaxID=3413048 RepID=UPI003BF13837
MQSLFNSAIFSYLKFIYLFIFTLAPILAKADELANTLQIHSISEETKSIKKHRLKKLIEHMNSGQENLKHQCRFESEISIPPTQKKIYLTFDDGPEPGQTEHILEVLNKYHVPATFFMIGEKVELHPSLVKLVRQSPLASIGNHSWSHPNFHDILEEKQVLEIEKSSALFFQITDQLLFRYPYGNSSCESNQLLKSRNYKIIGWHIDSCDWAFDHKGSVDLKEALSCGVLPQNRNNFFQHVISTVQAHNGGIILMHEIHPNTLNQLDALVQKLLDDGFSFGILGEDESKVFFH